MDTDPFLYHLQILKMIISLKAGSHDPIFKAKYYSDSKKLVIRINISIT